MDVPHLGDSDERLMHELIGGHSLVVDPPRSFRVAEDLHVVLECLRADGTALFQELLDLAQHERVPLERCGVVRLEVPYVIPELLRLDGSREPAVPCEFVDRRRESLEERGARRSAARGTTRYAEVVIVPPEKVNNDKLADCHHWCQEKHNDKYDVLAAITPPCSSPRHRWRRRQRCDLPPR